MEIEKEVRVPLLPLIWPRAAGLPTEISEKQRFFDNFTFLRLFQHSTNKVIKNYINACNIYIRGIFQRGKWSCTLNWFSINLTSLKLLKNKKNNKFVDYSLLLNLYHSSCETFNFLKSLVGLLFLCILQRETWIRYWKWR